MKCFPCNLLFELAMKPAIDFFRSAEKSKNFHTLAVVLAMGLAIRECSIILMALSKPDFLSTAGYTSLQPMG